MSSGLWTNNEFIFSVALNFTEILILESTGNSLSFNGAVHIRLSSPSLVSQTLLLPSDPLDARNIMLEDYMKDDQAQKTK
ncbi:hypothetical protein K1719_035821 [Acacia pycnantha]|nr:hypothetical protein K1719_035821 [Acacia pycnantha]